MRSSDLDHAETPDTVSGTRVEPKDSLHYPYSWRDRTLHYSSFLLGMDLTVLPSALLGPVDRSRVSSCE